MADDRAETGGAPPRARLLVGGGVLVFAWLSVYVPHLIPGYGGHPMAFVVTLDVMFFPSVFVLGGDFWDKFRALFVYGAHARFPEAVG